MRKMSSSNTVNLNEIVVLCPISYTVSVIGGRWKPLIIDRLLKHPMRYSELKNSIPSVTERVLTMQLHELEKDNIIYKIIHRDSPPKVTEYRLTNKGESLTAVLREMFLWGKQHNGSDSNNRISEKETATISQ